MVAAFLMKLCYAAASVHFLFIRVHVRSAVRKESLNWASCMCPSRIRLCFLTTGIGLGLPPSKYVIHLDCAIPCLHAFRLYLSTN